MSRRTRRAAVIEFKRGLAAEPLRDLDPVDDDDEDFGDDDEGSAPDWWADTADRQPAPQ